MNIQEKVESIKAKIHIAAESCGRSPEEITLIGVSKGHSAEEMLEAYEAGVQILGENYVQEFLQKYEKIGQLTDKLPTFHFIGHLQGNKVKYIVDKVAMIHSVDKLSLAEEIDKQAKKIGKIMDVLVEINIGAEESKSGILLAEVENFLTELSHFENIKVKGFMMIPPNIEDNDANLLFFNKLYQLFVDIGAKKIDNIDMCILSMGMSGDFENAIKSGSTLVRIGTALFGQRA